jgi:hypothetical protein
MAPGKLRHLILFLIMRDQGDTGFVRHGGVPRISSRPRFLY